jgi:hypothetical protein
VIFHIRYHTAKQARTLIVWPHILHLSLFQVINDIAQVFSWQWTFTFQGAPQKMSIDHILHGPPRPITDNYSFHYSLLAD